MQVHSFTPILQLNTPANFPQALFYGLGTLLTQSQFCFIKMNHQFPLLYRTFLNLVVQRLYREAQRKNIFECQCQSFLKISLYCLPQTILSVSAEIWLIFKIRIYIEQYETNQVVSVSKVVIDKDRYRPITIYN